MLDPALTQPGSSVPHGALSPNANRVDSPGVAPDVRDLSCKRGRLPTSVTSTSQSKSERVIVFGSESYSKLSSSSNSPSGTAISSMYHKDARGVSIGASIPGLNISTAHNVINREAMSHIDEAELSQIAGLSMT